MHVSDCTELSMAQYGSYDEKGLQPLTWSNRTQNRLKLLPLCTE